MRFLTLLVALLIAAQPLAAMSRPTGGGGRPAGGGGARPSGGGGGYNFNRDTNAAAHPPQNRPSTPQNRPNTPPQNRPNTPQQQPNRGNVNTGNNVNNGNRNTNINNGNRNTNVNNVNVNRNYYNNTGYHGAVIINPGYRGPAWGWHGGAAWYPTSAYWGGGFWGPFAIGVTSVALYGAIVANNQRYVSYQVQPSSPGATMLSNYHLTQTQCGPPNLVVVYGPNNSVICAYPNNIVSAGNYSLDTSNLSLVSQ